MMLPLHSSNNYSTKMASSMASKPTVDRAYSTLSTSTSSSSLGEGSGSNHGHGIESLTSTSYYQINYFSTSLPRDLLFCIVWFFVGVYAPSYIIRPIFGINMRPIPYQILPNSNDVVLDLSLNQPLVEDVTVNSRLLLQSSITFPLLLLLIVTFIFSPRLKPKYHDVHSSICTLLTTIGMSEFITCMIKFYVGRLRPNFYALCGFDVTTLTCTNPVEMAMEARLSFPSGHSSLSTSGMGVLTFFFLGRVGIAVAGSNVGAVGNHSNIVTKLKALMALTPLAYSTFCASSRLHDNWHHPSDVVGGICLGLFCSTFCYHLW